MLTFFFLFIILYGNIKVKENRMKDLTKGNVYKTFFLFGFPLVLSGLLSQAYATIDTAIAGKFLGDEGLAAIGATSPLISFLSALFWGYGAGFCIHLARMFGSGDHKRIKAAIYSNYLYFSVFCVSICVAMIAFHDYIFDFLNVEESLKKAAFEYYSVYVAGLLFITLTNNGVYIMNAFGISVYPFWMSVLAAILNVCGNLFCVLVLKMGIAGLAVASVGSAIVVDICYILKLRKCFREMGVEKERVKIGFSYVKDSFAYSIPNMFQQAVMYFSGFLISPLVNGIGKEASASYSVVFRIYEVNASVYQNSARALSNYSAQCVGTEKYDRIKRGVRAGLLQGILFLLPFVLVCSIFNEPVCSIFFKSDASTEARRYAYTFTRKYLPFIYANLLCNLFHALFRGVKSTGYLVSSTVLASVVRYVASLLLIAKFGMNGFFAGWVISWFVEAIYALILYFIGKWNPARKKLTQTN